MLVTDHKVNGNSVLITVTFDNYPTALDRFAIRVISRLRRACPMIDVHSSDLNVLSAVWIWLG